ncbi:MAG: FAD-dependent thymidylate synthase [bacterium]|nr:FAD-dependent thymidylate synthase [bacterium]
MTENSYVRKDGEKLIVTPVGIEHLKNIVTDPTGPVYAFTNNADPIMVAAAMARLSRSANDLRLTYLSEFAMRENMASNFIEKVTAEFGDDSVKQLAYSFLVVESASNLLTKLLEWGRLGGYLEQSTRYIYFDKKNRDGHYKYYIPKLRPGHATDYCLYMDNIFELYSSVVRQTTEFVRKTHPLSDTVSPEEKSAWLATTRAQACDAARALLPVATQSSVGIVATAQSIENLIYFLASRTLSEAQNAANDILRESKKVLGAFLKRAEEPSRGGAAVMYRQDTQSAVRKLVKEIFKYKDLPVSSASEVTLVDYWPKGDELNILVPEMIFTDSEMPLSMLKKIVKSWPYEQKQKIFNAYVGNRLNYRQKPERAFEAIHYEWELFIDYGIFRDLQRHRMLDMPEWQRLTAYYGYEIPQLIKDAGLTDSFGKCFELSNELFFMMKNAGYAEEAQYATLLGNKMRFRFVENAREAFHLHELRTKPEGHPGYRKVVKEMHNKLSEVHPLTAAAMKFVDKKEDPELTRLAAELATQRKLKFLE